MVTWLSLPLRRLLLLFIGGVAGAYAVIPHLLIHLGEFLADVVVIGVAASAGTYLAPHTALQSPVLDAALAGVESYWFAIMVSALALALSHLSNTGTLPPTAPLVATRMLVLSAVGGAVVWRPQCSPTAL